MSSATPPYTPQRNPLEEIVKFEGADFHTTFWPVPEETTIKGRIVFVHGFSEYSKVYIRIFEDLSNAGYEVFFFDQRGAGLTSPGSLKGITNEYHTFKDLDYFIEKNLKEVSADSKHVNKKIFLGGHSMGGGICLNYGVKGTFKDQIRGIFVTGPLIELHPDTRPSKILFSTSSLLMRILPNFKLDTGLKPEYFTGDDDWRQFLVNDKIISPAVGSLRQIYDFITRGQKLLDNSYNRKFSVPLFIIHGADDEINDPKASEKFIKAIPFEDKKIILPLKARHSVFLEVYSIYSEVKKEVLEWLESH